MQLLKTPQDLAQALRALSPKKIAVAYVGAGWKKWIGGDPLALEDIVLSPTPGSNPYAIEQIIQAIGIDQVHFLEKLHSKLYIGDDSVLIGSPNLSDNGFGPDGNHEIATWIQFNETGASMDLDTISQVFAEYKKEAQAQYPTQDSKKDKLKELHRQWQEANARGLASEEGQGQASPAIEQWDSALDRIHVVWWLKEEESPYNMEAVLAAVPEAAPLSATQVSHLLGETLGFLEEDDVRVGDWIVLWRCKTNLQVSLHFWKDVRWFYVDTLIPQGYASASNSKLAACRGQKTPPPPFDLTEAVAKRLLQRLASGDFPELRGTYSDPWSLAPADRVTPAFLRTL
ncbi:MAG: phospholipase D family protein [Burkholderiaceae bacterium]|nr:phospholipase D family protein [Burkholderiaceae bacterium]